MATRKKKAAKKKAKVRKSKRRINALNGSDPAALRRRAGMLTTYFESMKGKTIPVEVINQSELLQECKRLHDVMREVFGD